MTETLRKAITRKSALQNRYYGENNAILNHAKNLTGPVEIALHKFSCHPSILEIKEGFAEI